MLENIYSGLVTNDVMNLLISDLSFEILDIKLVKHLSLLRLLAIFVADCGIQNFVVSCSQLGFHSYCH